MQIYKIIHTSFTFNNSLNIFITNDDIFNNIYIFNTRYEFICRNKHLIKNRRLQLPLF
jgi:hypothetical protein